MTIRVIPFFLPTSRGTLSAVATLPAGVELKGPAVVMLPGDVVARARVSLLHHVAQDLARLGQPVLRFDYPGAGLAPTETVPPKDEAAEIVSEAARWFLDATGLDRVAEAGTCMGAHLALMTAASEPRVESVVAIGCPIRPRHKSKSRVRSSIAALDNIGTKVASRLTKGNRRETGEGAYREVVTSIENAATHADLRFVYGEDDDFLGDFVELRGSTELSVATQERVELSVLPGGSVRGVSGMKDYEAVRALLVESLSRTARSST